MPKGPWGPRGLWNRFGRARYLNSDPRLGHCPVCWPVSTTLKVVKHTPKMMQIDAAVIFLFCGTLGVWVHVPKLASAINRKKKRTRFGLRLVCEEIQVDPFQSQHPALA